MYDLQSDELRERVARSLKQQKSIYRWLSFFISVFFFVLSILIVATNASSNDLSDILAGPAVLWIGTLIFHFLGVLMESGLLDKQLASQIVARELGRQFIETQTPPDKRKREATDFDAMTLDEDGELIPFKQGAESKRLQTRE